MRSVDSEVVNKIIETLHELISQGTVHGKLQSSVESGGDEDRLVFLFLEEELNLRGIQELTQLPIGGEKSVVQFANNLPSDATIFTVLQKLEFTECIPFPAFPGIHDKLKVSPKSRVRLTCPCPYLTGTGYRSPTDQSTHQDGVYDLGDLNYPTVIGFALPQHITCTRIGKIYDTFRVFRSQSHYSSVRHQELGLPLLSSIGTKWQAEPKLGNNIGHKKAYGDIAFTFVREYRQFALKINPSDSIPLQASLIQKVKELTTQVHLHDQLGADESWEEFFGVYGTHVITSASGGGRIVVTVLENHLKNFFGAIDLSRRDKVLEIEQFLSNFLDSDDVNGSETIPRWQSEGIGMEGKDLLVSSIRFQGGDLSYENIDLTACHKPGERKELISKWTQTLPFSPIMLDTAISLEPLTNILDSHGLVEEARQLDLATQRIFGKSFWRSSSSKAEGRSWTWGMRSISSP